MPGSGLRLLTRAAFLTLTTVIVGLALVGLGIQLQSQIHINHDVGWIAHSAGWLLDGKRFGSDILDPNPPMAWFLMLPVAVAARAGLLSEVVAIQAWSWLLTGSGLTLAFRVLLPMAERLGRLEVAGLLIAAAAVMSILPIGNFGQREIVAFSLILPYLFTLIGRLCDAPVPDRTLLVLIGIGAGIGYCLKPFLLAVPLFAEAMRLLLTRNVRAVVRTEIVAGALTVVAYAILILLFARDYLSFALPLIRAVYWAYDDAGFLILERFKDAIWPAAYAIGIALLTGSFNRVHGVLLAGVAGFSLSFWLQNKGFPYHAYPMLGAGCVWLVYAVIHAIRSVWRRTSIRWISVRVLTAGLVLLVAMPALTAPFRLAGDWYRAGNRMHGDFGRMRQEPIDRLQALGIMPSDSIYALSMHPNPGFPTVNYLGVQWAGRMVTQFVIPATVRKVEVADPALREAIDRATVFQVEQVIHDLARHKPRFVMVEARPRRLGLAYHRFDDLAFYGRFPAFNRLWACYSEIEPVDQIRLFRRQDACTAAQPTQPVSGEAGA